MKKGKAKRLPVVYTDEPMEFTIIENFLPPPDQLVFTEEKTRVTINLNQSSVDFFKDEAKRFRTPYQKIIRSVLDRYARNAMAKGVGAVAKKSVGQSAAKVAKKKFGKALKGASA